MERHKERQVEDADRGTRPFVADRLGQKIFLTTALDGEVIPGRTAGVTHKLSDGTEFVHPDAVGANLKHTFKVICLDRDSGRILWERVAYEGPVTIAVTAKPALPLPLLLQMASTSSPSLAPKDFMPMTIAGS